MDVNFNRVGLASIYSYVVAGGAVTCKAIGDTRYGIFSCDTLTGYNAHRMIWGSNSRHYKVCGVILRETYDSLPMQDGRRITKVV